MNGKASMRIALILGVVSCLLSTTAWANDTVHAANLDFQSVLGVAGKAYADSSDYSHNTGAYLCKATGAGTNVVTYPFAIPDAKRLRGVIITGKRTSNAPPIELRVMKSCLATTTGATPVETTIAAKAPVTDANGFFNEEIMLGSEEPYNILCQFWVAAAIDLSSVKCTTGEVSVQKIAVYSSVPDRIFRGSFHTNVTRDTP